MSAASKTAGGAAAAAQEPRLEDLPKPIFVVEHSEEDGELGAWSLLEYKHAGQLVGDRARMLYTRLLKKDLKALRDYGRVDTRSVGQMKLKRVCVLDPEAKQQLVPEDREVFDYVVVGGILGDAGFTGRTQDEVTATINDVQTRHLGPVQMTTDTALYVSKLIVLDGKPLESIRFVDGVLVNTAPDDGKTPEVKEMSAEQFKRLTSGDDMLEQDEFGDEQDGDGADGFAESTEVPFRYVRGPDGTAMMPPGLVELLREQADEVLF